MVALRLSRTLKMNPESSPEPTLFTTQQVSEYLRISLSTVHHLTRTGKLRPIKKGRHWQFAKEEIDRYLNSGFSERFNAPEYNGVERRKEPRTRCLMQGYIHIDLPDHRWEGEGNILNISETGVFFEARDLLLYNMPVYRNARVTVQLIPDGKPACAISGKIVRTEVFNRTRFGIQLDSKVPAFASLISAKN